MKENNIMKYGITTNRVLLGLLILVPGLFKISGPDKVVGMLTGMGFPIPVAFAWILILSEIIFGVAILANYQMKYSTIPPIIIMIVAAIVTNISGISWSGLLMHLAIASNYFVFWAYADK